jgi:hypothetical protein
MLNVTRTPDLKVSGSIALNICATVPLLNRKIFDQSLFSKIERSLDPDTLSVFYLFYEKTAIPHFYNDIHKNVQSQ